VSAFRAGKQLYVIGGRLALLFELDIFTPHPIGQCHCIETGQFEVGPQFFQGRQFDTQEVFIPAAVQSDFVVGGEVDDAAISSALIRQ
jgi:hypothetical protein